MTYHFVWCLKYRRKVLTGAIAERLNALFQERAVALSLEIVALDRMPDHVYVFVKVPPTLAPQHIENLFKGYTARVLRDEFPPLRSRLSSLWSRSYSAGSAGAVLADTIQ